MRVTVAAYPAIALTYLCGLLAGSAGAAAAEPSAPLDGAAAPIVTSWPPPPARAPWCPLPEQRPRNLLDLKAVLAYHPWETSEGSGIRLHTIPGSPGHRDRAALLAAHQRSLRVIERFFGHRQSKPIDVFVFSRQPPSTIIRDGTVWPVARAVIVVYDGDRESRALQCPGHALAHVFSRSHRRGHLTSCLGLVDEGMARLLDGSSRSPHAELIALRRAMNLSGPILLTARELSYASPLAEAMGASFLAFVRERFGDRKTLRLLEATQGYPGMATIAAKRWNRALRTALGRPAYEVLKAWNLMLDGLGDATVLSRHDRATIASLLVRRFQSPMSRCHHWGWPRLPEAMAWTSDGRWCLLERGEGGWRLARVARRPARVSTAENILEGSRRKFVDRAMTILQKQMAAINEARPEDLAALYGRVTRERPDFAARLRRLSMFLEDSEVLEVRPALVARVRRKVEGSPLPRDVLVTLGGERGRWRILAEQPLGPAPAGDAPPSGAALAAGPPAAP